MGDMNQAELGISVKRMIVKAVKLKIPAESIESTKPLFGPDSVGLDSLDALELVIALEKEFGVRIPDSEVGRKVLVSVETVVKFIQENKGGRAS